MQPQNKKYGMYFLIRFLKETLKVGYKKYNGNLLYDSWIPSRGSVTT